MQRINIEGLAKALVTTLRIAQLKQLEPARLTEIKSTARELSQKTEAVELNLKKCDQRKLFAVLRQFFNVFAALFHYFHTSRQRFEYSVLLNTAMTYHNICLADLEFISTDEKQLKNMQAHSVKDIGSQCHQIYFSSLVREGNESFDQFIAKKISLETDGLNKIEGFPFKEKKPFLQSMTEFIKETPTTFHALRLLQLEISWKGVPSISSELSSRCDLHQHIFRYESPSSVEDAAPPPFQFKYTNRFQLVMGLIKERTLELAKENGYKKLTPAEVI